MITPIRVSVAPGSRGMSLKEISQTQFCHSVLTSQAELMGTHNISKQYTTLEYLQCFTD